MSRVNPEPAASQDWKLRYYEVLDRLEAQEKAWARTETTLRQSLSRLSLCIDGRDAELDRRLDALRRRLRGGAQLEGMEGELTEIVRRIEALDRAEADRGDRLPTALEGLIDAIPWPRGLRRHARELGQRLRRGTTPEDLGESIGALRELLGRAFDELRSTVPAEEAAPPGGGLLRRWRRRPGREAASESRPDVLPAAPLAPAPDPEPARQVLRRLVQDLELPRPWPQEVRRWQARLDRASDPETLEDLAHDIADAIARISAGAPAADKEDGALDLNEALLRLLERLTLPAELEPQLQAVQKRLQAPVAPEQWPDVLEEVADLIAAIRQDVQRQRKDLEGFLGQLNERLAGLDDALRSLGEVQEAGDRERGSFDRAVRGNIEELRSSVASATELEALKLQVASRLDTMADHLEAFSRAEAARNREAQQRIEEMSGRLSQLEGEARSLRGRIQEERRLAMVDALTRVPNRLAYEERAQEEFARWKRFGRPLSVVVLDIDHFKRVNDTFGHQAGDRVLKTVAQKLRSLLRETDFIARYGGEEFVLLMPGADGEAALAVAEKLRQEVAATGFHFREQPVPVTVSCGITAVREGDTPEAAFERADAALYQAKEGGRNRCELA